MSIHPDPKPPADRPSLELDANSALKTLFVRFIGRDLLRNRLRTGLTVLGITLGVAILLAINLANHTAVSHFRDSIDRVSGKANLTITSTNVGHFNESLLRELQWLWPLQAKMTPVIEQNAVLSAPNPTDAPTVVQVLGVDMLADSAFRSYDWIAQGQTENFLSLFERNHVLVGGRLAKEHDWRIGSRFPLLINDQKEWMTVSGILSDKGLGGAYGGDLILMDIGTAQEVFSWTDAAGGLSGQISRIDLIVPEAHVANVLSRLEKELPPHVEAGRPQRRSSQVEKMLQAYQYNLTVLSFISLLVGMFLIYNTMSITVIRRRPEIGTLRAVGASRRLIMQLFLGEALLFGVSGSLLGILLGVGLASLAVQAVSTTVANLYTGQPVAGLSISALELTRAFVFGVVMTLLGALAPVLEASAVQPAEASRRASYESKIQRVSKKLSWVGLTLWFIAWWAAQQPPVDGLPVFGFVSALTLLLGGAFLMPATLQLTLKHILPWLERCFHKEGRLSGLQLNGALGRTSVAVASLMIGIAMMVSLGIMIGSFRETVILWVNQTLKADLWIEPAASNNGQLASRISQRAIDAIRFAPGVDEVDMFYEFPIQFQNALGRAEPARVGVGRFNVIAKRGNFRFLSGKSSQTVIQDVLDTLMTDPSVIVTESFANRNQIREGQHITLNTPGGPLEVRVAGIYYDYSSDLGYIVMPRELYNLYYDDDSVTGLAVFLEPGLRDAAVKRQLEDRLGGRYQLTIRTNQELRNQVLKVFDNTFAITYALHLIAIVVALLGVMNSLFALVLESRRDFGILKYLGASVAQIRKMVLIQAGLLGLLGNLAGLFLGLLLSLLLVFVINKQSFGWTIQFSLPYAFLLQSFLAVLVTAIVSGLAPARLAAETQAPEVIRAE